MRKLDPDQSLRDEASRQTNRHLFNNFLLSVFLPFLWAVLGAFSANFWTQYGLGVLIPWAILALLQAAFWFAAYPRESTVLALSVENSDLRADCEQLANALEKAEKWVFHSYASHSLRGMSVANVRKPISSTEQLKEALDDLLAPLYIEGGDTLDFTGSERWSLTVYLYSKADDKLKPVWREKSRNHPSIDLGREWGRGQGHVGKAFVDGKIIVTGDASHPDVIQLCGAPSGLERDYDNDVYRSFASVPIGLFEEDGLPYGVLVGTSDHKDRFDEDSSVLLWHYADSIGVLAALGGADIDKLSGKPTGGGSNDKSESEGCSESSDSNC